MLYSALELSENLAYPLALLTFWAILATLRSPRWTLDALVIGLCVLAAAARIQLAAVLPAAFVAVVLEGLLAPGPAWPGVRQALRAHLLLTLATAGLVVAVVAALAGTGVLSVTGRYSNQRSVPFPPVWLLTRLLAQHGGGARLRRGRSPLRRDARRRLPLPRLAPVAAGDGIRGDVCFRDGVPDRTCGLCVLRPVLRARRHRPRADPRAVLHIRPAAVHHRDARDDGDPAQQPDAPARARRDRHRGRRSAGDPLREIINNGVASDTFGLAPLAHSALTGGVGAWPHATLLAIAYVLCLGAIYALARPNIALLVAVTAAIFVIVTLFEVRLLNAGATTATAQALPANRGWVDAAVRGGPVVVLQIPQRNLTRDLAVAETAFFNLSVSRLYYVCEPLLAPDFGEIPVTVDGRGRVRTAGGARVRARYVVAPTRRGVAGRVVGVNRPGHLVLLRSPGGVLGVSSAWGGAGVGVPEAEAVSRSTITCSSRKSTAVPGSAR